MRLELNIKFISATKPIAEKLLIKIIINGSVQFKTDWAHKNKDNIYPFYEKNIINVDSNELNYVKFQIRNQLKYIIAQKTVLNSEIKNQTQIEFKAKNDKFLLNYTLMQVISDQDISLSFKRKMTVDEEPEIMKNSQGKLHILKLGSDAYNFSQRLDPVIWLINEAQQIFSWRSPGLTIGFGIVLTLIIMNLKITLLLATLFLIFGKNVLIKKIQQINKKKNSHKRIWVPKQNTVFLQTAMNTYVFIYEKIHDFCLNEDKTDVISVIHHICQTSFIAFILLFVISIQKLMVVALWGLILLSSPSGIKFFKEIWPSFLIIEKQADKVINIIENCLKIVNRKKEVENSVVKEFYWFKYERWFMGKGWSIPIELFEYEFADESWRIKLSPKTVAPLNWQWISEPQAQISQATDQQGYEYTNQILKSFGPKSSFATVRRRKIIRQCEQKDNNR